MLRLRDWCYFCFPFSLYLLYAIIYSVWSKIWDIRNTQKPLKLYSQLHEDEITDISYSFLSDHLGVTSEDGAFSIINMEGNTSFVTASADLEHPIQTCMWINRFKKPKKKSSSSEVQQSESTKPNVVSCFVISFMDNSLMSLYEHGMYGVPLSSYPIEPERKPKKGGKKKTLDAKDEVTINKFCNYDSDVFVAAQSDGKISFLSILLLFFYQNTSAHSRCFLLRGNTSLA